MYQSVQAVSKRIFTKIVTFFVHYKTIGILLIVLIIASIAYTQVYSSKVTQETYTVIKSPLAQTVKVTGQVQSPQQASLSFQTSGQVSLVSVKAGDKVNQGKLLASLASSDAEASLLQAKANLENAEATLSQLVSGARPEEIAIKQQNLDNAKSSLDLAYNSLPDAIRNVDGTTADNIKNKLSPLFIYQNNQFLLSFSSCNQSLQSTIEADRTRLEDILAAFQKQSSLISPISQQTTIDSTFEQAYNATLATNNVINKIATLLNESCSIQSSSLDPLRTTITLVKTNMTGLFADLSVKRNALLVAKNGYAQATRDLDLTKAGTDINRIKAQSAVVSSARASVAAAVSNYEKTKLTAPFTGVISDVSIKQSEVVTPGKVVISMLAEGLFEVTTKIPEIDIVKVRVGQKVYVTLDAYGNGVVFPATVTRINPSASIEGTVPMYALIITFDKKDERILSGMTANLSIITEDKGVILGIPLRFVTVVNETTGTVTVESVGKQYTRTIGLGARGDDGFVEVTEGLLLGDIVVAPSTSVKASQKQSE